MPHRTAHAFTLIELLVVVTIIVVLLALLTPALDRAIEQAERAVCGTKMHGWGGAHQHYYLDNRRKILAAPQLRRGLARGLVPNHARWRKTAGEEAGDFNLDDIAPYIQGPNDGQWKNATYVGEAWYCPSSNDPYWYKNIADSQAKNIEPGHPLNDDLSFMYLDYAYFGLAGSKYRNQANRPQRLSNRTMGEGRILMSETVYLLASSNKWWFNHSATGYSMHEPQFNGPVYTGVPQELGVNQLYADGAVAWKDTFVEQDMDWIPALDSNDWLSSDTTRTREPAALVNFY